MNTQPLERIRRALEIISSCGGHDEGHHKQWVLDQVVRKLLTNDQYRLWVKDRDWWDEGIPP